MLPKNLESRAPSVFKEDWDKYYASLSLEHQKLDKDFLRQICFEHYHRFNDLLPKFNLSSNKVTRTSFSTKDVFELIRYDNNAEVKNWYDQIQKAFEEVSTMDFWLLNDCIKNLTWPFPPVIISHELGIVLGGKNLGSPYYLIEGTHRVSYINWLYENKKIPGSSTHEVLLIE